MVTETKQLKEKYNIEDTLDLKEYKRNVKFQASQMCSESNMCMNVTETATEQEVQNLHQTQEQQYTAGEQATTTQRILTSKTPAKQQHVPNMRRNRDSKT